MNPPNDQHEQLEKYIDSVLRSQPPRHAPASLESNVLAAIAQRAARPWWRQSFGAWPVAAKVIFLLSSVGFAKVGLEIAMWLLNAAPSAHLPSSVTWLHTVYTALTAGLQLIPNFWVYVLIGVVAAMYVLLFGVSAAAYRTLYASR